MLLSIATFSKHSFHDAAKEPSHATDAADVIHLNQLIRAHSHFTLADEWVGSLQSITYDEAENSFRC